VQRQVIETFQVPSVYCAAWNVCRSSHCQVTELFLQGGCCRNAAATALCSFTAIVSPQCRADVVCRSAKLSNAVCCAEPIPDQCLSTSQRSVCCSLAWWHTMRRRCSLWLPPCPWLHECYTSTWSGLGLASVIAYSTAALLSVTHAVMWIQYDHHGSSTSYSEITAEL
jgi:hypothetical protein